MCRSRLVALGALLWVVVEGGSVFAHVQPPDVVAYFLVDSARVRALVRVPTTLLADARLPIVPPGYLDVAALDAPLRRIAEEVGRSLDLTDGGQSLPAPFRSAWRISPQGDRSFDTAEQAVAHLAAAPVPSGAALYWNEAFVDVELDFESARRIQRLEARLNGLGPAADPGRTRATYVPAVGVRRTYVVSGSPERVAFEPTTGAAVSGHARLGLTRLLNDRAFLLFVLCLVVSRRTASTTGRLLGAAWAGRVVTVVIVQLVESSPAASTGLAAAFCAALAVVLAAVLNVVGAGWRALFFVAFAFGVADGLASGMALRETLSLAGSHAWPGILSHEAAGLAGSAVLAFIGAGLIGALSVVPVPEWAFMTALSALAAHEGSHLLLDVGGQLVALDLALTSPALAVLVHYWPVVMLALALSVLLGISTLGGTRSVWSGPAQLPKS